MKINKKRINNIEKYLLGIKDGVNINILYQIGKNDDKVIKCGFSETQDLGEEILPEVCGPVTRFNAYGRFDILKDEEREKRTIERPYHIIDWHGNDHYGYAHDERECYKRKFIEPPGIELRIIEKECKKCITVKPIVKVLENYELIKHQINLFLELFEECEILEANEELFDKVEVKKLNWKILPKGEYPWKKIQPHVRTIIDRMPPNIQHIVEENIKEISSYNPEFVAIGEGGFNGYLIYGFKDKDFVILESNELGNATYILDNDWEQISKLTKAQILNSNLEKDRYIHTSKWKEKISSLFN